MAGVVVSDGLKRLRGKIGWQERPSFTQMKVQWGKKRNLDRGMGRGDSFL